MKSKMSKKLIAFILCMVLVICNSVSILADTPAPETATVEKQVKETKTANDKKASDDEAGDTENVSPQSEESAPEVKTTEKKEETTEATTQKKDEADEVTTKAKEETEKAGETTTEAKETTKKEETTETQEEKTTKAKEETSETSGKKDTEKTTEAEEKTAPVELKYEDTDVVINVSAAEGIIPENAELSVTPIVKTAITADMSEEEKAEAEDINAQYALTEKKLNEDSEKNETTMEGFLAYDISFIVDGEEVEPSGDVKVAMDFKEAAIPEGVSENASVEVKHLKEDTSAADGVVVEDMTEKSTVETSEKAEVEKVEFTSDSFSTYTIYWGTDRYSPTLNIQVVDESGTPIGDNGEIEYHNGGEKTIEEIAEEITVPSGYVFTNTARIGSSFKDATTSWAPYVYGLRYSNGNQYNNSENLNKGSWNSIGYGQKIYFIYSKTSTGLDIVDNIATRGLLDIQLSEDLQKQIGEAEAGDVEVKYVWLKSENGSVFEEVELKKFGTNYNISEDGESLDVIIDEADKANETKYKVQLFIGDAQIAESTEFEIPYYKKIQNGSFETPISGINNISAQWSNKEYAQKNGVWQTTGLGSINGKKDKDIEVLNDNNTNNISEQFMSGAWSRLAKDGDQFAEINCEAAGALYQDVLTDKNVDLNYYLSHRGRSRQADRGNVSSKFDTMYLVIMPTSEAEKYTEHSELVGKLNELLAEKEVIPIESTQNESEKEEATVIYNSNGVFIAKITSDAADWHEIDSGEGISLAPGVKNRTYRPTSSLSRFFFISGATFAGYLTTGEFHGDTIGNLVDDIGFGQVPLKPASGYIKVEVKKTVTGLTDAQFEELKKNLTFTIQAKDPDSGQDVSIAPLNRQIIRANDPGITWKEEVDETTGLITATMSTSRTGQLSEDYWNEEYFYTVTETGSDIQGTVLNDSLDVQVSGGEEREDGAVLGERDAATFNFTNNYVSEDVDVTFTKTDENGEPLNGVKFALYANETDTEPIDNMARTSNNNGKVTYENLEPGTYYLRETETPEGFIAAGPWVIEVGDPAGSYTITGVGVSGDATEGYKIINNSFSSSVDVDKTVEVLNYDERTYNITLSAKSILNSITQQGEPVDVVLVFDTSRSMMFPGDLEEAGKQIVVSGRKLQSKETLDEDEIYYYIEPKAAATVDKLQYRGNQWMWTDSSEESWQSVENKFNAGERYQLYKATSNKTRLDYLKSAATDFVDKLNELSSDNQVGLVTFAGSVNTGKIKNLVALSTNYQTITDEFDAMNYGYTASGTNQAAALQSAIDMLDNSKTGHRQYVVLLTDGAPNWKADNGSGKEETVATDECWRQIESKATYLKEELGVTLMTLGVGISYVDNGIMASEDATDADKASTHLREISTQEDGKAYYYNTDNASELEGYFDSLFSTIVNGIPVEDVTVTDVIDPRFELVNKGNIPGNGQYNETTGIITWNDVTLPYTTSENGWTVTFTIKAKDEFMGGNVIPTNGTASGVSGSGGSKPFPQPAVNVKSLELQIPSEEETIYLSDKVNVVANVAKIKDVLAEKVESDVSAGESATFEIPESCQLTNDDILNLLNGTQNSISKNYSYEGTADVVGQFVYTLTVDTTMKPVEAPYDHEFESNAVGNEKEKYTLTVQYVPKEVADRPIEGYAYNSNDIDKYGDISSTTNATGTYTLKVIAGSIDIIKKLSKPSNKSQTFTFNVQSGDIIQKVSITVPAGETTGTLSMMEKKKLEGLKRGDWTVSEETVKGYSVINVEVGEESNTKATPTDSNITFTMGTFVENGEKKDTITDTDGEYNKGILGVAEFTNEEVMTDWQFKKVSATGNDIPLDGAKFELASTKQGGTTYYGKSGADGIIKWYEDEDCTGSEVSGTNLIPDTYTLSESVAPTGYVLSEEKWTVEVTANGVKTVTSDDSEEIKTFTDPSTGMVTFFFTNEVLYDLPSAGGSGIYWYTFSGALLMMGAALIVYREKRKREVLLRK